MIIIFLLGIANFALHRAVIESGHPMLGNPRSARFLLAFEFLVLVSAMMLAANGWIALAWVYGLYSALNAVAAWLIASRHI